MKKILCLILAACLLAACSPKEALLYLYGGDEFIEEEQDPVYYSYEAGNGLTVLYDSIKWMPPGMEQEDTVAITGGGQMDYSAVLIQVTDIYSDFLAQAGEDLANEANNVRYDMEFTVPDAQVSAVRYDCGGYQAIFAEISYSSGLTAYVTAATKLADYQPIIDLLQNVYPTGHAPEAAAEIAAQATPYLEAEG